MAVPDRSSAPDSKQKRLRSLIGAVMLGAIVLGVPAYFLSRRPPDDAKSRLDANLAAQAGRWEEAQAGLDRIADPNPSDWLMRAVVATNLKRLDAAAEALSHVPSDGPLAAQAELWKGRVAHARFLARPMEEALRRALALDPKLAEARRLLVYLYGTQGRRVELMEQFAVLAEQGPLTFDIVNHWCVSHLETINEPAKLTEDLRKFVANDPEDRLSRLGLAGNERKLSRYEESLAVLTPLPADDPDARAARVEVAFDRGDIDTIDKLLAESPRDHARLARLRGRYALRRSDGATALKEFRLAEKLEPDHSETVYGLAQALRMTGDSTAAQAYTRRADAQRRLQYVLTTIQQNTTPKLQLCCELAAICETAGYLREAVAWYRLAISIDPLYTEAQQAIFRLESSMQRGKAP